MKEDIPKNQRLEEIARDQESQSTTEKRNLIKSWQALDPILRKILLGHQVFEREIQEIEEQLPRFHELHAVLKEAAQKARQKQIQLEALSPHEALHQCVLIRLREGEELGDLSGKAKLTPDLLKEMTQGKKAIQGEEEIARALHIPVTILRPRGGSRVDPLGIARIVKQEIKARGKTLREESLRLGHHYTYLSMQLSQLEAGRHIRLKSAIKLLQAANLEISIDEISLGDPKLKEMAQKLKNHQQLARKLGVDKRTIVKGLQAKEESHSDITILAWQLSGHHVRLRRRAG